MRWPVIGPMTSEDLAPPPPPSTALPTGRPAPTPVTDDPPAPDSSGADACKPEPTQDGALVTHVDAGTESADLIDTP